jgi:predicted transcriptional regulator
LTVLSIRLDDTLAQAIKELAAADERPVSTCLERIIRQHAQDHGKEVSAKAPRVEQRAEGEEVEGPQAMR